MSSQDPNNPEQTNQEEQQTHSQELKDNTRTGVAINGDSSGEIDQSTGKTTINDSLVLQVFLNGEAAPKEAGSVKKPNQVLKVGIYSQHTQQTEELFDRYLDLSNDFTQGPLPTPEEWQNLIIPRIEKLVASCKQHNTLELHADIHNSLGIALGTYFSEPSSYTLFIKQFNRDTNQHELWSSRATPVEGRAFIKQEVAHKAKGTNIIQQSLYDKLSALLAAMSCMICVSS